MFDIPVMIINPTMNYLELASSAEYTGSVELFIRRMFIHNSFDSPEKGWGRCLVGGGTGQ